MSDHLYSSLFSLLPRNYASQGNSSECDHIEVAANYIKELEKKVKKLKDKREKLIKSFNDDQVPNVGPSTSIRSTNPSINENYVKIKACLNELEIQINIKVEEDQENAFSLSKVLKVLQLEEGLNVVDCAYSKVNQRQWTYAIYCQVDDGKLVDFSRLQGRLTKEIL